MAGPDGEPETRSAVIRTPDYRLRVFVSSTLKELARRWRAEVLAGVVKESKHEALADVYESIAELRYYREQFIRT